MAGQAVARSASSQRIAGDWPPSSNVIRLVVAVARRAICLPVAVPPVKPIFLGIGCFTKASPISRP